MNKKNLFITAAGIFLLAVFSLSLLNPAPARASFSGTDYQQIFENNVFGDNEVNQPSFSNETTMAIIASLNNMILGCTTEACKNKLGANASGAVGTVNNLIASLYATPPASSTYYLADLGQRLNLTQPAYAQNQGVGFSGLTPLLPLWKAARNVAYTFFIFVFLIIGFAIMFRAKINPQTVVTIQSAIPKAVVALILVTFSYAIAGLMIDLMYVTTGIGISLIKTSGGKDLSGIMEDLRNNGLSETLINFLNHIGLSGGMENLNFLEFFVLFVEKGVLAIDKIVMMFNPFAYFTSILPDLIEDSADHASLAIFPPALLGGGIVSLILGIVLLFAFFKLFLGLLLNYIQVIIQVIIAPFLLMISALPGQNTFGNWLKGLVKNLLPFPAVVIMLTLSSRITSLDNMGDLWIAPLIRPPSPFGLATPQKFLAGILSFGLILLTAKIPDIIKGMFERKPFAYGAAIGEPLKAPIKGLNLLAQSAETIDTYYKEAKSGAGGIKKLPQRRKNPNVTTGLPSSNQP